MPTLIGAMFFLCGAYCFLFRKEGLLGLLIIAGVFQAASAANFGKRGIPPYYVIAAFLVARALLDWSLGKSSEKPMPQGFWLLFFGCIAIASAFVLPFIFAGVPVYDPKVGIDLGLFIRPPLQFGLNNIGQAAFLACHLATAYAVMAINFSPAKIQRWYVWGFYLVFLILAAQSVCQLMNISFPNSLFLNNPGYAVWEHGQEVGGTRNPGPFAEPSLAGGFLVMYCTGFLAEWFAGQKGLWHVVLSLVAITLVASGGSLLALGLATLPLVVRYFPFRFPWYINLGRTKRWALLLALVAAPLALALFSSSGFRDALMTNTVSKTDSGSFINRTAADVYALQLLVQTHGLGVGLGSNRASSLLTTLLSNVGILGVLAFGTFSYKLLANLPSEYEWLRWAIFALLLNMCIDIPDVTMPTLWIPILFAMQCSPAKVAVRHSFAESAAAGSF